MQARGLVQLGLTFLLTLHKRGIPAVLYGREPSFALRGHLGGFFDLGRGA